MVTADLLYGCFVQLTDEQGKLIILVLIDVVDEAVNQDLILNVDGTLLTPRRGISPSLMTYQVSTRDRSRHDWMTWWTLMHDTASEPSKACSIVSSSEHAIITSVCM